MGDKFDFQATLNAVGNAVVSVICHILFDFAMVGLGVAAVLAVLGFVMGQRKHRFEKRFYTVAKNISLACLGMALPGIGCLIFTGHLPESGVYVNFSLGFLVLWSMVTIYLCAEEMNYEWFVRGESPTELEIEPSEEDAASTAELDDEVNEELDKTLKISENQDVTLKLSGDEPVKAVTNSQV